ncbi:hypothetical protein DL96DRAFT_1707255 [Flagelloscypha sp. PMI_526]|nr:hypothetical protein DL96DRAFT_1707255 [Flagelloscypha sp. PMI_526]
MASSDTLPSPNLPLSSREAIARYTGLDVSEIQEDTVACLRSYLHILPESLLAQTFAQLLSPRRRSVVPAIRNRRLAYTNTNPSEFIFSNAKTRWPALWRGSERPGVQQAEDEHQWAKDEFMDQNTSMKVGKLPQLLRDFEEERQAERIRAIRRERAAADQFVPEEDSDSDLDSEEEEGSLIKMSLDSEQNEESETDFEQRIKQLFIYGLLDNANYDTVDWSDAWDVDRDKEKEEDWFMNEDNDE